ncbi:MAG TPA: translation initiation factor IF-3 [Candidatus Cloacimonas sp.]|nr:translation initiation factor IF-3 [Candidatus Cloacimonas sp.]HOG26746.1 translation initiation factor IF-3 [Candidatus Cloacimonas sp.]HOQ77867.1 translation initiation factor IF-3 [Candidatus Cloacimonas sp.]HPH71344.1 translation initiation factor IF-3 [Candidatus Cloacimonas sp.]HPK60322.1 translation initiation factor IF-3 [Candidatus Cloacimonas sp.]
MKQAVFSIKKIAYFITGKKEVLIIRIKKGKARTNEVVPKERINNQITADKVRLIGPDGKQIGIVSLKEALRKANDMELDLVEISPNAEPPVCRILDFSKYYFEKEKKAREARKRQHEVEVKEIKFGPNTEEHDYNFKKNNAIKFLKQHNKVKFTVRFRGRQMAHKELGYKVLDKLKEDLAHLIEIDSEPVSERNMLSIVVSPKKDIDRILAKEAKKEEMPASDSEKTDPQA